MFVFDVLVVKLLVPLPVIISQYLFLSYYAFSAFILDGFKCAVKPVHRRLGQRDKATTVTGNPKWFYLYRFRYAAPGLLWLVIIPQVFLATSIL